ncbi:serine hydrolase [Patescibacteria group bacterium]|nr:serine hydrolase [Patescibacteria group bacterium]
MAIGLISTIIIFTLLASPSTPFLDFFDYNPNILPKVSEISSSPPRISNNSLGIKTTAQSIMVIDEKSQQGLFEKNPYQILSIASITKLMTVLVFLDLNQDWNKSVVITDSDLRKGGIEYLLSGESVNVEDLFYLTLVSSTNEAAAALVRSTGISQENYVNLMNQKARDLGMLNTHFEEVTGLNPSNQSTAIDLIKLAAVAFTQKEITTATQLPGYNFTILNKGINRYAPTTNKLLSSFVNTDQYSIVASKTGFIDESGYCQIIKIKNAQIDQSILIAILGSQTLEDRWQEIKGLVDWVFNSYTWE